eukprot:TRINITY_DN2735_c0_g1_i8.p3 TRINITY_DN2735_c0_g1~~TRINITY_DN2735_c0_g1_i8.p3  ORF type:complete len:214 (-),score=8.19 TRINITY_DN2735_c0_g1_i8:415-1056(-)
MKSSVDQLERQQLNTQVPSVPYSPNTRTQQSQYQALPNAPQPYAQVTVDRETFYVQPALEVEESSRSRRKRRNIILISTAIALVVVCVIVIPVVVGITKAATDTRREYDGKFVEASGQYSFFLSSYSHTSINYKFKNTGKKGGWFWVAIYRNSTLVDGGEVNWVDSSDTFEDYKVEFEYAGEYVLRLHVSSDILWFGLDSEFVDLKVVVPSSD